MMLAALFISSRDWMAPAALLLLAAVVFLFWGYKGVHASLPTRLGCIFLKSLGLVALGFCLLEPFWSTQRARPGANFFALLADNSEGMNIKDKDAVKSRGELLREALLSEKAAWQGALEESFQVRRFQFDSRLQAARDFGSLEFDGRASAIGGALSGIAGRYQGQPLAGVLLFTDGNATDLPDASAIGNSVPVYPVVIGRDEAIRDIAIQKVAVSQTAFEDAPVTIEASVLAGGYSGSPIVAQLYEWIDGRAAVGTKTNTLAASGRSGTTNAPPGMAPAFTEKPSAELVIDAPREGEAMTFRFQTRPSRPGISFYRLRVAARSELEQFSNPKLSTEATLANNSRMVVVDRGRGPYHVLYVTGRPNWEFKFLNRAVEEDDQVRLTALIRVAKREAKFEFKGRAGESSNPLFRGFDKQGDDTERYDQPVFKILSTREEPDLAGGFPKTAEALYGFHAIILDDLEAGFFTHDQMVLLEKFVSERGGGLLMLGGMESFHQGSYERTPIGDLLPVYLDRAPTGKLPGRLKLSFTREGWLQPWARLRNNEEEERARLDSMPGFQVLNRVREIKPGASVLATVTDGERKEHPALAVQRFGRGRSAALLIGDMWSWGLRDEAKMRDLAKAWRQMVRWLVADVPARVELLAEQSSADPNQAVNLQVRARDKKFLPLDNAAVQLDVRFIGVGGVQSGARTNSSSGAKTSSASVPLSVEAAPSEAGLYRATHIPRETGGYLAEVSAVDSSGVAAGQAEAGWTSDPAAEEFRSLKPNRALMEAIAKKTGGEVIPLEKLDAFVKSLPTRKAPITESASLPLWHTPWMFLLALGCFLAEWGIRRWKGLA